MRFEEWLFLGREEATARDYLSYYRRLGLGSCGCSFPCILERAREARTSWGKRVVRLYARWCWEEGRISYDHLMRIRSAARLSSSSAAPQRPVRIRLPEVRVPEWLRPYVSLLFYSGARLKEVHMVVGSGLEPVRLDGYAYVELPSRRGYKRSYVIFAPTNVLGEALEAEPHPYRSVAFALHRRGLKAKDFRKNFYQLCTYVAPESVCDFYQGRVRTVSARHYEALLEKAAAFYPNVLAALEWSGVEGSINWLKHLRIYYAMRAVTYLIELSGTKPSPFLL